MTKEIITSKLSKILKEEYDLEDLDEKGDSDLINELGLDSLDIISLSLFIEDEFNVILEPSSILDNNLKLNLLVNRIYKVTDGKRQ